MSFKCEQCGKEFNTEQGLEQHKKDKHGVTSHDTKEMKKKAREEWKEVERKKAAGEKQKKNLLIIAAAAVVVLVVGYFIFTSKPSAPSTTYNLTGIPSRFVHWHADVDAVICGEDKLLPYGPVGGMLGTSRMHTHDRSANLASLPGSDGNGVIHTEGVMTSAPAEHTLGRFTKNIGIKFSKTEIMDKKNGDKCGESEGTVKVYLDDNPLEDPVNYLPRDGDFIRIEFSPVNETSPA